MGPLTDDRTEARAALAAVDGVLGCFNAEVDPWRVDALWRHHKLAVEINGHAAHSSPWAHDRDHRKEQFLQARGLTTRRFTALQAVDEPALLGAGIAAALAAQNR